MDVTWRACEQVPETVGHISARCPSVKQYQIKGHNVITDSLADKCKHAGWIVSHEPKAMQNGQIWKCDLVLTRDGEAMILDPTFVYKSDANSLRAAKKKVTMYDRFLSWVAETWQKRTSG